MSSDKIENVRACENPYAYTVAQNLRDAGCAEELVEQFMALQGDDMAGQLQLLHAHRRRLLEALHREERKIDCLDYLLYRMQGGQNESIP